MDAYDTGLLVINGIGAHPPTQTLDAMMEPLLARMRAEGSLIDTVATQLGDPEGPGGKFDALVVDYRAGDPPENRKLLVVEGRWQGLYRKPNLNKMSAWLYARQGGMILDVVRYLGGPGEPFSFRWRSRCSWPPRSSSVAGNRTKGLSTSSPWEPP